MYRSFSINLVFGILLGFGYFVVISIVLSLSVLPTQAYVDFLWVGIILESIIALIVTCLVFGSMISLGLKYFVKLVPAAAAVGFLAGAIIYLVPFDWIEIESSFGKGIITLRVAELFTGAGLLSVVWWYIGRSET